MTELIVSAAALLAAAGVGAAWYFRRKRDAARRRADRLREHADRLTLQLVAAEQCVGHLAATVIPAAAKGGEGLEGGGLLVPAQLDGTPLAERLRAVTGAMASAVADVRGQERAAAARAAAQTAEQLRQETERHVARVREESVGVARAAVRGFANNVVARSARLGRAVSQGVRRHISDEAYATLVEIDHLAQQMLLTASGYAVLAGDKLSRRWPATSLTDITRAAMGRIEGYERIKHPDMGSVVVEGRAVEAVVHALAVLLDNALRYSPPAASVHVSLEQGHHACFLIVDDAGLRMDDERLLWAGNVMSGEQRDDITRLGAHPQTGLRVASLLAENYGFRVELTAPNIYQGTRAMVVLPKNLIVDPAARAAAAAPAGAGAGTPAAAGTANAVPAAPGTANAVPAAAGTANAAGAAQPAAATVAPTPALAPAASSAPGASSPAITPAALAPDSAPDPAPDPVHEPTPRHDSAAPHPGQATAVAAPPGPLAPPATTASGLTVRRRSPAPAPARGPAPAAAEPGRPAVAAAWAAGTRRGRDGEPAPSAGSAEPRVSARESAPAPSSPADADTLGAAHEATPTAAHHAPHPAARDAAHDEGH
ncbi:ATP-binding protein [Streptomyces parvulus]|uniref:ATP-binding protein n=1 Tax=Streptomyces parvulus TaxID=146923 RepID=UPI000B259180|nr:ATP-binding protein [Streptomyces parvulus]GGR70417.1 ATP-binding protein [Streptomyces parvulus]